jgi:hypothetical protein
MVVIIETIIILVKLIYLFITWLPVAIFCFIPFIFLKLLLSYKKFELNNERTITNLVAVLCFLISILAYQEIHPDSNLQPEKTTKIETSDCKLELFISDTGGETWKCEETDKP